jgi:hypothetical protein
MSDVRARDRTAAIRLPTMGSWGRVPVVLAAGVVLAGCTAQSTAETDRQADTLSVAISWPRQYSAEGYARAALATRLGRSPGFSVLEVTEFDPADLSGQTAHLVIRIHEDGAQGMVDDIEPLTVCYAMDFNYYGVMDTPKEVGCPEGAQPITYPSPPAWADAAAFEAAFAAVLERLPDAPSERRVENALYGAWLLKAAELVDDVTTNLGPDDPRPAVRVRGADVAVAITAGPECLLGSRVGGVVRTQRPPVADCVPTFG